MKYVIIDTVREGWKKEIIAFKMLICIEGQQDYPNELVFELPYDELIDKLQQGQCEVYAGKKGFPVNKKGEFDLREYMPLDLEERITIENAEEIIAKYWRK